MLVRGVDQGVGPGMSPVVGLGVSSGSGLVVDS